MKSNVYSLQNGTVSANLLPVKRLTIEAYAAARSGRLHLDRMADLHTFEIMGTTFKVDKKYQPIKALGKGAYGVVCAAKAGITDAPP